MENIEKEIKPGIKLHMIKSDKFKTNLIALFISSELTRENITKNALISTILRRGTKNMTTQEEISKQMEEMYGAAYDSGIDKIGDNQIIKFYIETINDNYLPDTKENLLEKSLEKILEIVFNPYIENNEFKKEYVEQEKNFIQKIIEGKIDSKARYAFERCIEEMYRNEPYGLYKFGYIEDLEKINGKNLYEYYQQLIQNAKIDIFISGLIDENIEKVIEQNENIKKLQEREGKYKIPITLKKDKKEENIITESMDISQGKLLIGLDVNIEDPELRYDTLVYNALLGGTANSKLFQNVREKAHLAYVASSNYMRHKGNIIINCGIDIENYEKALDLIKEQIQDMKDGKFSDEDLNNVKTGIIDTIKTVKDEQDTQISYYFSQELCKEDVTIDEYIKKIENVTKEDVINIANKVSINTIYFLKN